MSENINDLFPIYGEEIVAKFKREQMMYKSFKVIEDFIDEIFQLHLPSPVRQKIATVLSIHDLTVKV